MSKGRGRFCHAQFPIPDVRGTGNVVLTLPAGIGLEDIEREFEVWAREQTISVNMANKKQNFWGRGGGNSTLGPSLGIRLELVA